MDKKVVLRLVSGVMFVVAVVFVLIAVSCPTLGRTIYMGNYQFGAEQWCACYAIYAIVMVLLFIASFFVKNGKH